MRMPRKKIKKIVKIKPVDAIYRSTEIASLINKVMLDGKKSTAEKVVYNALELIKKDGQDPLEIYRKALKNVTPEHEIRSRRVGGTTCAVPRLASAKKAEFQALKWLVDCSRERKEYKMEQKLYAEIISASNKEGSAMSARKRQEELAEQNKSFVGLNW